MYAIFDLLYLDGHSLIDLPYTERRARLEALELAGPAWRVPAAHPGDGERLLEATREPGARGGRRQAARHPLRARPAHRRVAQDQEHAPPGAGDRRLAAGRGPARRPDRRAADGRATTTATAPLRRPRRDRLHREDAGRPPPAPGAAPARDEPVRRRRRSSRARRCSSSRRWWPRSSSASGRASGVMRAPSFKGLREDKPASEVVLESGAGSGAEPARRRSELARGAVRRGRAAARGRAVRDHRRPPAEDHELGQGAVSRDRVHQGRPDRLLRADRAGRAPAPARPAADAQALPERRRRGRTSTRSSRPRTGPTGCRPRRIGDVNYTLAQDRPTLVWLANLADIELHTSLSLAASPEQPTMLVFDLDPGAPAGIVECCEVALVLRGLFDQLGLVSFAKTSGSKGLQVYVPLNTRTDYSADQAVRPAGRRAARAAACPSWSSRG